MSSGNELKDKKVLVVGTGLSGTGAAEALYRAGAYPVLFDENKQLDVESVRAKLKPDVTADVFLGELPEEILEDISLAVFSPGVPTDTEFADRFRAKNIPIWGEIELAYRLGAGKVIGITGTNGKTTTTSLVGEIMAAHCSDVNVVGNIGNPYTLTALKSTEDTVTVAEISSFQLETIERFCP